MPINYKHLNKLKYYRLKQKLTQQAVAAHIGHESVSRVSAWENGTAKPVLKNLIKLSNLYRVSIEKLYPVATISHSDKPRKASKNEVIPTSECDFKMTDNQLLETFAEMIVEAYFDEENRKFTSYL